MPSHSARNHPPMTEPAVNLNLNAIRIAVLHYMSYHQRTTRAFHENT